MPVQQSRRLRRFGSIRHVAAPRIHLRQTDIGGVMLSWKDIAILQRHAPLQELMK